MAGACAGIRVLECSRGAAGSLATMMLADFGADVIRLERPAVRTEVTPADLLLNRGKRSVLFDRSDGARRQRLLDLVASADVLVEDWMPEETRLLDLDDERLDGHQPGPRPLLDLGLRHGGTVRRRSG